MRLQIQQLGRALSAMVMPNIGAFIAWGLITALFIPSGWLPCEDLAQLIEPMLKYMLPLVIAYTAGSNVAGGRGAVVAVIAVMGVVVGSDIPMFIGAMIMGPLAGYIIGRFDKFIAGKVPMGFEMLVSNFSIGIIGMACAIVGYYAIGPCVEVLTQVLSSGVALVMEKGLLPLAPLFIEPAKVLFLNNAINHGILSPVGIEQAREAGESILFLLETNPGPGLGVLLAYWAFGHGPSRESAPGAVVIELFGGIHEIYFPYILMRPALIVAPILGSVAAVLFYVLTSAGLVAPASPGSIIALLAMAPKGKALVVLGGCLIATIISFAVAAVIVKKGTMPQKDIDGNELENGACGEGESKVVHKIVFACDAGVGSSAFGATRLRKRLEEFDVKVTVTNSEVNNIPSDADVVVCQKRLCERARASAPEVELVTIDNFLDDKNLDKLLMRLVSQNDQSSTPLLPTNGPDGGSEILCRENIITSLESESKQEAITRAGELLVSGGYVNREYIAAMLERESLTSTYLGMGIAIPHGTSQAKGDVIKAGIVVLQYPQGVDFGSEKAYLFIGIAANGDQHIDILSKISLAIDNPKVLERLITVANQDEIYSILK